LAAAHLPRLPPPPHHDLLKVFKDTFSSCSSHEYRSSSHTPLSSSHTDISSINIL
jgi:hypothetical protein